MVDLKLAEIKQQLTSTASIHREYAFEFVLDGIEYKWRLLERKGTNFCGIYFF